MLLEPMALEGAERPTLAVVVRVAVIIPLEMLGVLV
jgi:hypothetical protein